MEKENNIPTFVSNVAIALAMLAIAILATGCTSQEVIPFEPTSQLDYHNGYWVTKVDIEGQPVGLTVVNDMFVDAETKRVTVYAQSSLLGKVLVPPQVNPGECTELPNGDTGCFHPNAVYLNGSGQELMEADGTGTWWVKHSWVLDGEGYENCELRPQETYDDCFWVESVLMDDGLSMKIGDLDLDAGGFFNIRTPVFNDGEVTYKVTRYSPTNVDASAGEIDLTPNVDFVLDWACEEKPSAFNNITRSCPSVTE